MACMTHQVTRYSSVACHLNVMRALSLVLVAMEEDVPVGAMSMLEVAARDGLRVKPRATIQVT